MRADSSASERGVWGELDLHLFHQGRHFRLWEKLGAHPVAAGEPAAGWRFTLWAPNARRVSVIGEWNGWRPEADPLEPLATGGLWHGVAADARQGQLYKYRIESRFPTPDAAGGGGEPYRVDKADPVAFAAEPPPGNASRLVDLSALEHHGGWRGDGWGDDDWRRQRLERQGPAAPLSLYEMHPGSWRRPGKDADGRGEGCGDGRRFFTWRQLAEPLADHLEATGFTHVELMPVMEHPYYGSWGYQTTGYYAATSRYGSPEDLTAFVDHLHRRGFGVILDWVPSHFATDGHGLGFFDGTHLYEHADPRQGFHPDWGSWVFNYGRPEVVSFLVSSALYWLEVYHADGLRVDGVASMLYLDYSREEGEWVPNRFGDNANLEAVDFLRALNRRVHEAHPGVLTIAEESTAWPQVTGDPDHGGLGFDLKWDMGWMHDTLRYLARPPVHRRWHHRELTFRGLYMHTERFCLSLSHDEVVHGKRSLLGKMPGDAWQMRANLRLLLACWLGQPGKQLLFMGGELGTWWEWSHEGELPWHLLEDDDHLGLLRLVADLHRLYRARPALHAGDFDPRGFEWIDADDAERAMLSWLRWDPRDSPADAGRPVAVVLHTTPEVRRGVRLGLPQAGGWTVALNTDDRRYGGSGAGSEAGQSLEAEEEPAHGRRWSLTLDVPPLGALFLVPSRDGGDEAQAEEGEDKGDEDGEEGSA